ncbi:MAG: hypothetical protein HXY24_07410 [Rubrivivax sp.]|nr:hypothetical protein [Rubrivivax sp.]
MPADQFPAVARLRRPGLGLLVGVLLLGLVEAWLHTDGFLLKFRSVFAAGRAMDKVVYAQHHRPGLLILGNSRADNGFDPRIVLKHFDPALERGAFNLGLPGADMRVLAGIVERLDHAGVFGNDGTRIVLLSLDESLLQAIDTLGQDVFFAGARRLWAERQFHDAFRATLRLYGYTENFRQLREPAVLRRFIKALHADVDPVGGAAADHLGYRAGVGALQDDVAARQQEAGSAAPPSDVNVRRLWWTLDQLAARGVQVIVVHPPLLNREVLYLASDRPEAAPYRAIAQELHRRGLPRIALAPGMPRDPAEFVNAGHLNDRGAQRYSALLGQALRHRLEAPATSPSQGVAR